MHYVKTLSIHAASSIVQDELNALFYELGPGGVRVSTDLIRKLRIRSNAPPDWTSQFSSFLLLYPQLQSAPFTDIEADTVRRANVAHVLLLAHAFAEDRCLDGQVILNTGELVLIKQFLLKAFSILDEIVGGNPEFRRWRDRVVRANAESLLCGYDSRPFSGRRMLRSSVFRIAAGRAAYGKLAPMALLYSVDCPRSFRRMAENAYDCWAVGMQWLDDLQDWREDLAVNDENILLTLLRRLGLDPYRHPDNELRTANVGNALAEKGLIALAAAKSSGLFRLAAAKQAALGCDTLATMLEDKAQYAGDYFVEALAMIETEIADARSRC